MTPEERAEKILVKCLAMRREFVPTHILAEVAAQIREAVEEARRSWISKDDSFVKDCMKESLAEAYEDAAKIAEDILGGGDPVADEIRARKDEVGK